MWRRDVVSTSVSVWEDVSDKEVESDDGECMTRTIPALEIKEKKLGTQNAHDRKR